jgi:hypothetical protein
VIVDLLALMFFLCALFSVFGLLELAARKLLR